MLARYFRYFAKTKLRRWQPRVVVVTGSSGKSTMLRMLESQLGDQAKCFHDSEEEYSLLLDAIGLDDAQTPKELAARFFAAPLRAYGKVPEQKLYIVEATVNRPGESLELAQMLAPEYTVWLNTGRTRSAHFQSLVESGEFKTIDEAIANEYANFARAATKKVLTDGDDPYIKWALSGGTQAEIKYLERDKAVNEYRLSAKDCLITVAYDHSYVFKQPQPPAVGYLVAFMDGLLHDLGIKPDFSFAGMKLPPGRSSVFKSSMGFKMIDSTHGANLDGMKTMLEMMNQYPGEKKVLVLGDMLEQGENEQEEHEKLAEAISQLKFVPPQVILVGPLMKRHVYPVLHQSLPKESQLFCYINPTDVLDHLKKSAEPDWVVLFKGARYLEGVIEFLLEDASDAKFLPWRGPVYEKRRAEWGLKIR